MKLNLKEIKYYFLTTGNQKNRSNHIFEIFEGYDIKEVNPILGTTKSKSGSVGTSRMIDYGLKEQDNSKTFQPFVLLEDDVSFMGKYPEYIEIPYGTDLMYIGLSPWGMGSGDERGSKNIKVSEVEDNSDIFRIYNMLSTHGIIICSPRGASTYQKCIMESYYTDSPWDIILAKSQPYLNVYAFKTPLVYQDKKYGGAAYFNGIEDTKITYNELNKSEYIPSNLDDNIVSIMTTIR